MTQERWEEIRAKIKAEFQVTDEYEEDLAPGVSEVIEFASPLGALRASFITRPKFIGTKTSYSNRIGSDVTVDREYSEHETVCHLELEKQSTNGSWEPMNASMFS